MIRRLRRRPLLAALVALLILAPFAGLYTWREELIERWAQGADVFGRGRLAARYRHSPTAQYYYGLSLLEVGETSLALERLNRAAELERSPRTMGGLARALYASGDQEYAVGLARVVLSEEPGQVQALWTRALDFEAHHNSSRAADCYERIVAVTPEDAEAWFRLGVCQSRNEKPNPAEEAFRRADQLRPRDPTIINELAMIRLRLGAPQEAEELARRSLQLERERASTHLLLAKVEVAKGSTNEAEKELREALRLAPEYPLAHHELGMLLARERRWEQARREFEAALRADPDLRPARYEWAKALRHLGRTEEAQRQEARYRLEADCAHQEELLRSALYTAKDKGRVYFELARLRVKWGHLADAYDAYRIGLQHDPTNRQAQQEFGALARRLAAQPPPAPGPGAGRP